MSFLSTPNMNLPVPVVGQEAGPQYAVDINSCFTLLDQHDHTPGKGVQITPNGININAALSMADNFLTSTAGITFQAQGSTPALNTVYESGVDLYYVDGNGNNIRITQSGGIAGSPGSISNLTSPASAAYVSGLSTFVWQSNTNIAANMDCGALLLRNLSPNSTFALTLQPPAGLAANYTITLPALPASTAFLTIDNSGNMASSVSTTQGILTAMLADLGVTGAKIANATITAAKMVANTITTNEISATAGIIPSQTDSLTSGLWINDIGSDTGSFSTSSATLVDVTGLNGFIPNLITSRPAFIRFRCDTTGSIVVSGTATIEIQTYSGASTVSVFTSMQLSSGTYPPSILDTILPKIASPWTGLTGRIRVQVKVSGGSVQFNNVIMSSIQV